MKYYPASQQCNADALSRLPLPFTEIACPKPAEIISLVHDMEAIPIKIKQLRVSCERDSTVTNVIKYTRYGWAVHSAAGLEAEYKPYFDKRLELSVDDGCLLWGSRFVIPNILRKKILFMLHEGHPGISHMKSLARSIVWWPGIDAELESCVNQCSSCQTYRKASKPVAYRAWPLPDKPWQRVHIDHAGPIDNKYLLLVIDSYSKWLDVHIVSSTSSEVTVQSLRNSFAMHGLPLVLVTDNSTSFTSEEFGKFCEVNGVKHLKTPPRHPSSNGVVERAVQTVKQSLKKVTGGSLQTRVNRVLFRYRTTPHSTTGQTPGELLMGRKLVTHLELLRSDFRNELLSKQWERECNLDSDQIVTQYSLDEEVYVKLRPDIRSSTWSAGKITKMVGPSIFEVVSSSTGASYVRHADHLRKKAVDNTISDVDFPIETPIITSLPSCPLPESDVPFIATPPIFETGTTIEPTVEPQISLDIDSPISVCTNASSNPQNESSLRRSTRSRKAPDRYGDYI